MMHNLDVCLIEINSSKSKSSLSDTIPLYYPIIQLKYIDSKIDIVTNGKEEM